MILVILDKVVQNRALRAWYRAGINRILPFSTSKMAQTDIFWSVLFKTYGVLSCPEGDSVLRMVARKTVLSGCLRARERNITTFGKNRQERQEPALIRHGSEQELPGFHLLQRGKGHKRAYSGQFRSRPVLFYRDSDLNLCYAWLHAKVVESVIFRLARANNYLRQE